MDIIELEKVVNEYSNDNFKNINFIIKSFRPFIIYRCTSIYINGYDFLDLVQECNMALFKALKKYKKGSNSFYSYAKNTINNRLNELIRINANKICTVSIENHDIEDTTSIEKIDTLIDLNNLLSFLPKDEKNLIIKHYLEDKTIAEISNNDKILMRKNYTTLYRALKKLKIKQKNTKMFRAHPSIF